MTVNVPLPDFVISYVTETVPPVQVQVLPSKARRLTLSRLLAPVVVAAAPGQPPDPDRCTCDPARWKWQRPGNIRHEPTCPRSKSPR